MGSASAGDTGGRAGRFRECDGRSHWTSTCGGVCWFQAAGYKPEKLVPYDGHMVKWLCFVVLVCWGVAGLRLRRISHQRRRRGGHRLCRVFRRSQIAGSAI